jgi:hypothetical protein
VTNDLAEQREYFNQARQQAEQAHSEVTLLQPYYSLSRAVLVPYWSLHITAESAEQAHSEVTLIQPYYSLSRAVQP